MLGSLSSRVSSVYKKTYDHVSNLAFSRWNNIDTVQRVRGCDVESIDAALTSQNVPRAAARCEAARGRPARKSVSTRGRGGQDSDSDVRRSYRPSSSLSPQTRSLRRRGSQRAFERCPGPSAADKLSVDRIHAMYSIPRNYTYRRARATAACVTRTALPPSDSSANTSPLSSRARPRSPSSAACPLARDTTPCGAAVVNWACPN